MSSVSEVMLDTHAWIWLVQGSDELNQSTIELIERVRISGRVLISAISLWEIARLTSLGRIKLGIETLEWFKKAIALSGVQLENITPDIAVESCNLPGTLHSDPADRIIVATARHAEATLITRDAKILQYSKQGHVNVLQA